MRAYRPGRMGGDEYDEDAQRRRMENVKVYVERAQAGLPLFEPAVESAKSIPVNFAKHSA